MKETLNIYTRFIEVRGEQKTSIASRNYNLNSNSIFFLIVSPIYFLIDKI